MDNSDMNSGPDSTITYTDSKIIKKIFWHSSYDLKTVETFLENMAADGYMFVSRDHQLFRFKRCKPVKLHFFVDILNDLRKIDNSLGTMRDEYVDYCEECGWHFISNDNKYLFFYTTQADATPIQTDNELRLKLINSQTLRTDGLTWLILLSIVLFQFGAFDWNNLAYTLIDDFSILCTYLCYPLIFIPEAIRYTIFYLRNKNYVKDGADIEFYSARSTFIFYAIRTAIAIIISLGLIFLLSDSVSLALFVVTATLLIITAILLFSNLRLKKAGFGKMTSIASWLNTSIIIAICAIFGVIALSLLDVLDIFEKNLFSSRNEHPFTLSSLNVSVDNADIYDTGYYPSSSPFGYFDSFDEYVYDNKDNIIARLDYDIIISNYDFVIDSYINDFKSYDEFPIINLTDSEASLWQAKAVYLNRYEGYSSGKRLIVYDNKLLIISSSNGIEYTDEQIKKMGSAVKAYTH